METLRRNLSALKERQPELARSLEGVARSAETDLHRSSAGLPVHRYKGRLLHSLKDPAAEAARLAAQWRARPAAGATGDMPGAVAVFGFGSAHHLSALLQAPALAGATLVVVEPDARFLRAALEDLEVADLLRRARIVCGEPPARAAGLLPGAEAEDRLLVHPPSAQAHERYLEALQAHAWYRVHGGKALRIALIGPVYGGSYPVACHVRLALEELGHVVEFVDLADFNPGYQKLLECDPDRGLLVEFEKVLSRFAEQRVLDCRADLVLALAQAPLREESLGAFRERGIPVAYWFVEDARRMTYWSRVAPLTDAFFMIQRAARKDVLSSGARCVHYLPMAALPSLHAPEKLSEEERARYGARVSFLGAGYPNRRRLLARLGRGDLKVWGDGWGGVAWPLGERIQENGRRLSAQETVKVFNATRVNLNIHSSTHHEGIDPHGDFVNPRTFEIASCGAFQLVDRRSLLGELFSEEEMVCYGDLDDLKAKIDYALDQDAYRSQRALEGRARVLREHTYALRMQELLGVLYARGLRAKSEGRTAAQWIEEAQSPELKAYFGGFPADQPLDLDGIVESIRKKPRLDDVDRVFLTLAAFKEEATCRRSCS
ncbi:MAG: glycosyltransferase [bacterium]